MIPYENVIISDYDGCLGFWEHGFHMFMVSKGYTSTVTGVYDIAKKYGISKDEAEHLTDAFNRSAALSTLPPVKDAIKYVRKLHEDHGYVFHCITAIPNTRDIYDARKQNIESLFGKTAFERIVLCEHSANKKQLLAEYQDTECYWIEDIGKQAVMGLEFGLKPLLMDRHYNREFWCPENVRRVYNWKEIYQIVTDGIS